MILSTMEYTATTITTPQGLIEAVAKKFGVPVNQLIGKSRERSMVDIRSALVKTLRDDWHMSYPKIGELINRDHTTAMNLYRRKVSQAVEYVVPKDPLARVGV
jgi:chromosomal replication initiation ATPase DnaA